MPKNQLSSRFRRERYTYTWNLRSILGIERGGWEEREVERIDEQKKSITKVKNKKEV